MNHVTRWESLDQVWKQQRSISITSILGELSKANVPVSHDMNPSLLPCLCTTNTIIKNNQAKSWLRISAVFLQSQVIIMKKTFFTVQKYQLKSTDNLLGSDASTSRWQCAIISSSSWDSASASDTSGCEDVPLCSVAWWWAVLECNCIFGGLKYMSCFLTWSKWRSAVGFCHHSQMLVLVLVN